MFDIRIDRLLSVKLVHPFVRMVSAASGIPILMYHGIRECRGCAHPYYETHTCPRVFAAQMKYLHDSNYRVLNVRDLERAWRDGTKSRRAVAVTFDDGFDDVYERAFPVLASFNMSATVFIVSQFAGTRRETGLKGSFMSWDRIRELDAHGWEIGSHTSTHCRLASGSTAAMRWELQSSKDTIEDELGSPIRSFSYPYAYPESNAGFRKEYRDALQSCSYDTGVTTIIGTAEAASDPLQLPRIPVNLHDDLRFFAAKLEGAYDWMHSTQYVRKRLAGASRELASAAR